jgi:chromosome segregation ATPase
MTKRPALLLLLAVVMMSFADAAKAIDWSSCQNDLDRLRRAARDAADAAEQAASAYDDLESARSDAESQASDLQSAINSLRYCQSNRRECSSERWRFESARSNYESARSRFESARSNYEYAKSSADSEMDGVSLRVRSSEYSCDTSLGAVVGEKAAAIDPVCRTIQRYKGRVSAAELVDFCKRSNSEADCRRCLE